MIMFTRILFSFVLALSAIFSYGQDVTSIRFDSSVLDMGNFPSDSCFVTKEFSFTNTGSAKLYFYSSSPDCACVKVALPKNQSHQARKAHSRLRSMPPQSPAVFLPLGFISTRTLRQIVIGCVCMPLRLMCHEGVETVLIRVS